jgi:hypothetical protein
MAILSFCGIDVSKDRLDVVVLAEGRFCSGRLGPSWSQGCTHSQSLRNWP